MRALLVVAVLVGCRDPMPDTAPPPDAPVVADFFGEPCSPASTPTLTVTCRVDSEPRGYCTPAGVCRPFCAYYADGSTYELCRLYGGIETWTNPDGENDHGTCYCDPPR